MRTIDQTLINNLVQKAKKSPRKRCHYLLHQHHDLVQRMINAVIPGSYIPPHQHKNPDKIELFVILKGSVACIKFTQAGKIDKIHLLQEKGPIKIVDIRPAVLHSFVALKPSVMLEIVQGPYQQKTHKNLPSWTPRENTPEAKIFLKNLEAAVQKSLKKQTT